jgi:hypothetical protein
VSEALGKAWKILGEGFAEYDTRQRKIGKLYIGNDFFAEYFLLGTWQRLYRVSLGTRQRKVAITVPGDGDEAIAECHRVALGKGSLFTECPLSDSLGKEAPCGALC